MSGVYTWQLGMIQNYAFGSFTVSSTSSRKVDASRPTGSSIILSSPLPTSHIHNATRGFLVGPENLLYNPSNQIGAIRLGGWTTMLVTKQDKLSGRLVVGQSRRPNNRCSVAQRSAKGCLLARMIA